MKRFQNSTFEYIVAKRELAFRDAQTNTKFFSLEFTEEKQIHKIFSLYPMTVELKGKVLELKFSVENLEKQGNILTIFLDIDQLDSDKSSIINLYEDNLDGIVLN